MNSSKVLKSLNMTNSSVIPLSRGFGPMWGSPSPAQHRPVHRSQQHWYRLGEDIRLLSMILFHLNSKRRGVGHADIRD